jgi:hypothetical protein
MDEARPKFVFPQRGFYIVTDKVAEADFFLERLIEAQGYSGFPFYFSAFVSAARSVTFALQAVMAEIPDFDEWYAFERKGLQESSLAKFFVQLRNHLQKIGSVPVSQSGKFDSEGFISTSSFIPIAADLENVPDGEVTDLSRRYLEEVLTVVGKAYRHFDVYVDPRALFTTRALDVLNWSVEDLEEALGFPRGWTHVPDWEGDLEAERLNALRAEGGDEEMEQWLAKYEIGV